MTVPSGVLGFMVNRKRKVAWPFTGSGPSVLVNVYIPLLFVQVHPVAIMFGAATVIPGMLMSSVISILVRGTLPILLTVMAYSPMQPGAKGPPLALVTVFSKLVTTFGVASMGDSADTLPVIVSQPLPKVKW